MTPATTQPATPRVLVAMSGGVDSSVAAALLRDAGHEVTGVTLKLWGGPSDTGCCSVSDVEDARRVAAQLGVPHYVFNFEDDFTRDVVDHYVASHEAGETPNPCVECNRSIKFGRLLERARATGFDAVATGHHARVVHGDGGPRLLRGADRAKDQSYVLSILGRDELARALFPVGEMTKDEVRARAAQLGLRTAAKAESMDVCFIERGGRERFLETAGVMRPGVVMDVDAGPVGRHDGTARFTVGQRRGTGVALGERRYVVDVDVATATVTIGHREHLRREEVVLRDLRFAGLPPQPGEELLVQTRAHGEPAPAVFTPTAPRAGESAGESAGEAAVRWREPQPRVAPGQVVALYRGDEVVGGGIAT